MNPGICTHHLASPSVVSFQQFSPSLPLLQWEATAVVRTPEPCYATAPNNDHLLLLSVQHLAGHSTRLHMDYLFIVPHPSAFLSPVTFPVAFVLLTTRSKQQPKMKGLLICLKHPLFCLLSQCIFAA